jgi:hypothetical protein
LARAPGPADPVLDARARRDQTSALGTVPGAVHAGGTEAMQRSIQVPIDEVYVPAKRKRTLDRQRMEALAEEIIDEGLKTPIMVRNDGQRWVLVEGLHRLEALRAMGETEIAAYPVQARQH